MRRQPITLSDAERAQLTVDEKEQYDGAQQLDAALSSLLTYMQWVSPETEAYPHLKLLCETVEALIDHRLYTHGIDLPAVRNADGIYVHPITGEPSVQILEIDEPPGHGKSFCVSKHLPAWYLSNFPERRVGLATYGGDFAREWGGEAQRCVVEHPEFGISIDRKHQAQDAWRLKDHKGRMFTAGIGGPFTGKRIHLGIIDDPVKDQDEAMSKTIRERNKNWWKTSFFNRKHPDGETVFIIMATRWHEDDLSGHLLSTIPHRIYRLSLPALAFDSVDDEGYSFDEETERRDPLGRRPGEALAPSMWPRAELLDTKEVQGELWFQAMYQGRPSIDAGNKFRQFGNRWTLKDGVYTLKFTNGDVQTVKVSQCYRIGAIDTAATESSSADYSVFTVADITPNHYLIIRNVDRHKITSDKHQRWFIENWIRWRPRITYVENKTFGTALIQNIKRLGRYVVIPSNMVGDKEAKAQPATEGMSDGYVLIPEESEWVGPWVEEHKKFPNGTHDDMVDTTSILFDEFTKVASWATEHIIEDYSMEARIERHFAEKDRTRHEHPEIGAWY